MNTLSNLQVENNPESTRSAETPLWLQQATTEAKIVPGKGQHYELCFLDFNIDIESNTCSVTVNETGGTDLSKACTYCYAKYNYKKSIPYKRKRILERTFSSLKLKIPEFSILRIGKNHECGSPYTRKELLQVLEYCVKYKVRPIVTSKILEYDPRVADLVIKSDGVVHISLGRDELESGAVLLGYNNDKRFEVAKQYLNHGCVTAVRVVEDITLSMPEFIKKVQQSGMPILVTPLHYPDKNSWNLRRSDISWEEAKEKGLYKYTHGALRPEIIHNDWKITKERCGVIAGKEYCNNCNLKNIRFSEELGSSKKQYNESLKGRGWN